MGDVIPIKRINGHMSTRWPDARQPWHAEALDAWDAGRLSAARLRELMASDKAFAAYAARRLGRMAGVRLCGND